ncbi:MAG TPA: DUF2254 family protein [Anaerolineales bacterium]|nr:DUF2254 family protein [Anaerolineales bacterium]
MERMDQRSNAAHCPGRPTLIRMKRDALILTRGVIVMAAAMLTMMAAELAADLSNGGYALAGLSHLSVAEARHLTNGFSRSFNQLVGVAFTTIAIAVPLTANMYSLKFLEFIIKDRIIAAILILVVFANLNNIWVMYALKDDFVPVVSIHISLAMSIFTFALLFPYLYYIFRFLHPNTLLERLGDEIVGDLQRAARQPGRAGHYRREVSDNIEHIANIAIRSIDRADRNTAIECIHTLERVAHAYWAIKGGFDSKWFDAEPSLFLGFSSKAVLEIDESRSWVEMKLFSQFRYVMSAAVPKMHDLVSTVAKTLRRLGIHEAAQRDVALRELVVEYFNTFIRMAIVRKDTRAVFSLFDQYRAYAESLNNEAPELVQEIAFYFEYYGQVAREGGLTFIVESVAHDLGVLVQHAYQNNAANRHKLLDRFLHYDQPAKTPLPGVKKAQAILASYLMTAGRSEEAALIGQSFAGLEPKMVEAVKDDLLHIKREKYWEINERRINMDYVPDDQREKLKQFFEKLKM